MSPSWLQSKVQEIRSQRELPCQRSGVSFEYRDNGLTNGRGHRERRSRYLWLVWFWGHAQRAGIVGRTVSGRLRM
jgi:hypothetical protein